MKKALFLASILTLSLTSFSRTPDEKKDDKNKKSTNTALFTGFVKVADKDAMNDITITIISNTNDTIVNNVAKGKFKFDLDYNKTYTVVFEATDLNSKQLFVDLKTGLPENYRTEQVLDLTVSLDKLNANTAYMMSNLPIAKAYYNKELDGITFDYEYTKQLKTQLAKLEKENNMAIKQVQF